MVASRRPSPFINRHDEADLPPAELDFISGLENGQAYFNTHTTNFPSGEISLPFLSPAHSRFSRPASAY